MKDFSIIIQIWWNIGFSFSLLYHMDMKLCMWYDNFAVMPYAKHHNDYFKTTWMRAEWNFLWIWIMMEKVLSKIVWHFVANIFKCIYLNEHHCIFIQISMKLGSKSLQFTQ